MDGAHLWTSGSDGGGNGVADLLLNYITWNYIIKYKFSFLTNK